MDDSKGECIVVHGKSTNGLYAYKDVEGYIKGWLSDAGEVVMSGILISVRPTFELRQMQTVRLHHSLNRTRNSADVLNMLISSISM